MPLARFLRHLPAGIAALLFSIAALASPALAQTGPFVPSQPYFTSSFGNDGVEFVSVSEIWIDVDGSGIDDAGDTRHPVPPGLAPGSWTLRLTPSRRVMVAFASSGQVCPGTPTVIRLYNVPSTNGASFAQLGTQQSLGGCIQEMGFNDVPTNAVRTAWFREPVDISGNADILWWDLVTGVAATSPFPYHQGFGFVDIAPWGTMAWVQHTIDNGSNTAAYSIVNLCPPQLGQASQPGLTNQPDVLRAHVESAAPAGAAAPRAWTPPGSGSAGGFVVVARTSGGTQVASFNYSDCSLPPPVTGACCLPGGGCLGGTTQGECETALSGTWQGATTSCDPSPCPPPPVPELTISLDGPLNAEVGTVFIYTLIAGNEGTGAATNTTVLDSLPTFMTFVFASDGGTYAPFSRRVTWNLGTLPAGDARVLTLGVRAPCNGTTTVNSAYRISSNGVAPTIGAPALTTTLDPENATPLGIVLTSTPLAALPLQTGNRVRYTVQLTNTVAQERPSVRFQFRGDLASTVVALVDSAGGHFTPIGPTTYQWEGTLGPLATKSITWETGISECRSSSPGTERLNSFGIITVSSRCGQSLGFAITNQTFAVAGSPFAIRLDTTSPTPAQATSSSWISVARPGTAVDFALRFVHSAAGAAPGCSMAVQIPQGLTPAGSPPFIGSPPAGVSWDPDLQIIRWSGSLPSNDSVVVAFRANLGDDGCMVNLLASGYRGGCTAPLTQTLGVIGIPEPPPGAHIVGLDPANGLYTYVPGSGIWKPLVCGPFANSAGVGRTPDGSLWVAGQPTWRVNPTTLDFQIFPLSFHATLGLDYPFDCHVDPRDSTIVFVGYQSGLGLRVRRWNPKTSTASFILNDPSSNLYGPGNSVVVGANGLIGVQTANALLRIDPANPPAFLVSTSASQSAQGFGGLCFDTDGQYLLAEAGPATRRLFKVNPVSGAFSTVTDLGPDFSAGLGLSGGVAALPDQRVYVGAINGEMVELQRASGNAVVPRPALAALTDLLYIDGPTLDAPAAGVVAATLTLQSAAPNPFTRGTTLRFALPRAGSAAIEVFDLSGRRVRTIERGERAAGEHAVTWDGRGDGGERLGAGLYFVRLTLGGEWRTRRVVLAR